MERHEPGNDERISLKPIGAVRARQARDGTLLADSTVTCIEIFPPFVPGLLHIESNSHIIVMGWLHDAERDALQVLRPDYEVGGDAATNRGVFACRSMVRPNPVSVTTAKLLGVRGNCLYVDWLDLVEGTRIIDIKPHAAGFDGVFSARNIRELSPLPSRNVRHLLRGMTREAENFHGERCPGVAIGIHALLEAMRRFGIGQKEPGLLVDVGSDGCVADTLQALSGATFGNRRLRVSPDGIFSLGYQGRRMRFQPRPSKLRFPELLEADAAEALRIEEVETGPMPPRPP